MNDAGRGEAAEPGDRPDFIHRHKRMFAAAFVLTAGAMMPWSGGAFRYVGGALPPANVEKSTLAPAGLIDPAGLFDAEEDRRLRQRLEHAEAETGVRFAVITTRGLRGETVKDFTNRYHNGWWNSGDERASVIVLFSPADRSLGISNSKSLDDAIAPFRARLVNAMKHPASRGDFEAAAMMAIEQMEARLARPAPEET